LLESDDKINTARSTGVVSTGDDQYDSKKMSGVVTIGSARRLFILAVFLAVFLSPYVYVGNFAGDSQVHLIYGENASRGDFFEFNPGEKSSGVSSPGYMLLVASFFKVAPAPWVPVIVKVINIMFWYGLLAVVFLVARRISDSTVWSGIATAAVGLMPGSVYNSTIGMENGIFGFVVVLWVYLAMRAQWFVAEKVDHYSARHELLLGFVAGIACFVRPEGFIVAAIALAYRALRSTETRQMFIDTIGRSVVFLLPFSLMAVSLGYFHHAQTGEILPTSGVSRILMSNISGDSLMVGPIFISLKFTIRLLQYFPITLLAVIGTWLLVTKRSAVSKGHREVLGFLVLLFAAAYVFYSAVVGSVHLARYIIFVMPGLVLVAMVGSKWLWEVINEIATTSRRMVLKATMLGLLVVLGSVFIIETDLRLGLDSDSSLWKTVKASSERQDLSEAMISRIGTASEMPISIALQEVQIRYWLDDRFLVRSLDGRVDSVLLDYATRKSVDHIGYLKERGIQFLLSLPNYNRNQELWSLRALKDLPPGESTERDGVILYRLPIDRTDLTFTTENESGNSRWTANTRAYEVLDWFMEDLILVEAPPNSQ